MITNALERVEKEWSWPILRYLMFTILAEIQSRYLTNASPAH
jgi:hypothetical protein